ncbi:MAG: ABC transporter permease subunit [Acidilobus sp.]
MAKAYAARIVRYSILQILLGIVVIIWLTPLYIALVGGFKTNYEAMTSPIFVPPSVFDVSSYSYAWSQIHRAYFNSLIEGLLTAVIAAFLGSMAGFEFYVISQRHAKLTTVIFTIVSFAMFIPIQALLVPLIIVELHLLRGVNTYYGPLFAFLTFYLPTGALLMSIFAPSLPKEIIEAARIDGASDWTIFRRVAFPLLIPGFLSTFIYVFIMTWNNFFIAFILNPSPAMRLVPYVENTYIGGYGILYNKALATAFLASLPPLVIFVFLGRYFIRGLATLGGGVKGL